MNDKILSWFSKFESIITLILSFIIALIIVFSIMRIMVNFYKLFLTEIFEPSEISFEDYQKVFGSIITLLISLEFMSSILKVLKSHEIRCLLLDVILITGLAIARKLIIFDYENHDPASTIVYAGLLASIGIFYFLIKFERFNSNTRKHEIENT